MSEAVKVKLADVQLKSMEGDSAAVKREHPEKFQGFGMGDV